MTDEPAPPEPSPPEPSPPEPAFKVTSAADILSYVMHTLGFQPTMSLVLLTMCGKRVGATLRVDLPADDVDPGGYAAGICSILASDTSADGALLILYTGEPWVVSGAPPRRKLVSCLEQSLNASGLSLRDGWLVTDTSWRDYFCTDSRCCPRDGHPLTSVENSPLNAELVYRGSSYADSLSAAVGAGTPKAWTDPVDLARRRRECQANLRRRWTTRAQFAATLALWDHVLAPQNTPDPAQPDSAQPGPLFRDRNQPCPTDDLEVTAHLLASLGSRTLRDAVLVLAGLGWEAALDGALDNGLLRAGEGAAELPPGGWRLLGLTPGCPMPGSDREHLRYRIPDNDRTDYAPASAANPADQFCDVLIGRFRGQLHWQRIDATHHLLSRLSAVAEGEPLAAVLTMLGWIEWARGRGSRAHLYLGESLKVVPGYTLAELLEEVVARGMLAEWSRDKDLAWRNGTPHAA